MIRIAIVEDNAVALRALQQKLEGFSELSLRWVSKNGLEALEAIEQSAGVDLVLMDIDMPVMDGIEATRRIKEKVPEIKIVMVTIYDDDEHIFNAIKAGADSYILKDTKKEKIYETITDTMDGGAVMSPSIALKTLHFLRTGTTPQPAKNTDFNLSEREQQILEAISKGLTNKAIANDLFISPFTVKRHIENIYQKLQAKNRIELIDIGKKGGWL